MLGMAALTDTTSDNWSKRVMVPVIMLSDAGTDEETCRAPLFEAIWRMGEPIAPLSLDSSLNKAILIQ